MEGLWEFLQKTLESIFHDTNSFYDMLLVCVCLDYISGVLKAIVQRKLSSEIGAKGICKKFYIFIIIGICHMLDLFVVGKGDTLRSAVTLFYICNEIISILENASDIGLPIPEALQQAIQSMKQSRTSKTTEEEKPSDSRKK